MTVTVQPDELVLDRTVPVFAIPHLDPSQARVAAHDSGPLLVLGGPGTGKTTALISAAAARVTSGTDPARVLLLTLGRTAVAGLRSGLAARLPDHTIPDVRTWHGFAYSVVDADRLQRAQLSESGEQAAIVGPLQLLTGAEYEARVRELVKGALEDHTSPWPKALEPALTTRGFARDVRALLLQLRTLGIDPFDLARIANSVDDASLRETFLAAAAFAETAYDVFDFEGVTDHADVLHRAGLVLADATTPAYDAIYVDQAHDLDPAMTRLLAQLARGGTAVVLAADPDQAVESFRGSEPRLLGELEERVFGRSVPTLVLPTDHAHAQSLRAVIERVTARIPAAALPADVVRKVRAAIPSTDVAEASSQVLIKTFDSAAAEAAHVSDLLLRRHSDASDALAWSDMAVVVHGPAAFAPFARAFNNSGIPFAIPRDEVPLRDDPAARVLLTVLELAVQRSAGRVPTPELVRSFILGPLVRVDSAALRRLSRALRAAARAAGEPHITADQALVQAVLDQRLLLDLPDDEAAGALVNGAGVLAAAVGAVTARRPVSEALWTVWTAASHYGERLGAAALRGGAEGRRADRDLDAVMGLFDAAERADARYQGRRGVGAFLDELRTLDFASESLAERGAPAPAVTVLTARRARGQFWPLVVVAGVNDGEWPLVSASHNIVGADRLTSDGIAPAPTRSARLADERRVFHVAVSRALSELVITAVASADDDGPQPSRFVRDVCVGLDVDLAAAHTRGYPRRALNVNGLVSSIRRLATEDTASAHAVHAAATRLAKLAALTDSSGRAVVHGANPEHWWGVREVTANDRPINDPQSPVRMSATGLQAIEDCGLRRFFEKEAAANRPDTQPAAFGTVVHSLAEALINNSLPAESEAVEAVIDAVWPQLASDAAWASAQERIEATDIADRLLAWHLADRGRRPVEGEKKFDIVIDVALPDGRADSVRLNGSIDRVEVDVDDPTGVHIVDFKTSRYPPVIKTLEQHPQLGVYRLIVEAGAVDDIVPNAHVAGAELVELRQVDKDGNVKIYGVSGPTDGTWPDRLAAAAAVVRDEVLEATPSDQVCRLCPLARLCPAKSAGRQVLP